MHCDGGGPSDSDRIRVWILYPNSPKTWLIVKEESYVQAQAIFRDSGVSITKEGKRYLGAAIGNDVFKEEYVREKVATWVEELEHELPNHNHMPHMQLSHMVWLANGHC